ncbi:hypothetical protein EZS27_018154 [termite gut metagenome]|uniref:Uncharacterized protein n=1 Tax=termite gut metagenome TaxID=433724 RepID=A0A5J4RIR5_9ZZZZ
MTAKSERIGKCNIHPTFLRFIKRKIKIIINIHIIVPLSMINGRRNNTVPDSKDTCNRFNRSRSTKQMTRHRFRGTDVQFISMCTEYFFDSLRFGNITYRRRCTVYVDIINICGSYFRIFQRLLHHQLCSQSFRMRSR